MGWARLLGRSGAAVTDAEASASSLVDLLLYASGWRYGQPARCGMLLPTRMGVGMAFGGNLVPVTYLRELMIRQGAHFQGE